jgi:GntR family transcriptional regulator, transcriptional repressor for pyruvate dehydrogenase complex
MLEVIERSRLSDTVARKIKQYIADQSLKPGDRLPTEHALAEQLGVSRISVREATKALEFVGVIETRPGRGITVGHLDMARISEFLGFHLTINQYPPLPLIQTRIIIETGALPHAAQRMAEDPAIYHRLHALVERFRGTNDLQEWIDLDIAFHRALLEASGLGPLVAFNDLLQIFFQQFRESLKKAEWKRGIDSHQRIIDFLRDQQVSQACDELRRHIESHKNRMGVQP